MEHIELNNGLKMPMVGFGTMNIFDIDECTKVLKEAYDCGYRLFDCAQIYGNEEIVGQALINAKIPREEIFLTTKVWFDKFENDNCRLSLEESMKKLQINYLDLVLIHWPYGNVYHAWRELEKMYQKGKIKAIGVSNYQSAQLFDLIMFNNIKPVLNQIKTTITCQRKELKEMMDEHQMVMQGYQIFGKEETLPFYDNKKVKEIGNKYNKSTRQIAMKYLIQSGISIISRPMKKIYMEDNLNLFDFKLNEDEMKYLSTFDILEYNTTPSYDYQRTKLMLEM